MATDGRVTESSKQSKYPRNSVFETPAGHQLQIDNTPKGERIFWRHSAGTYMEITADGNTINFSVGDSMTYNKSGETTTTDENSDGKTFGNSKSQSGGGDNSEIAGKSGKASGKTVAFVCMGDANIKCENAYVGSVKNLAMNIGGDCSIKCKGNMTTEVEGNITTTSAKVMTLKGKEKITLNPNG